MVEASFIYLQSINKCYMVIKLYLDYNCIYSLHLCNSGSGVINNGPGAPTVAPQCPLLHLQRTTGALETAEKHQWSGYFGQLVSWLFLFLIVLDTLSGEVFGAF